MPTTYAIPNGRTVFDATTYTGNGTSQSLTNTFGFKPDLVWGKDRTNIANHGLVDSVRGVSNWIGSNTTNPGGVVAGSYVTAFNSNGFTVGTGGVYNANGDNYVGWQWQAGQGTTTSNTNGSITTQVSVNQTAGFSIVKYTGTGSNATIGHGLGQAPKIWWWKNLSSSSGAWAVNYYFLYNSMRFMFLDTTDTEGNNSSSYWGNPPTSTVNYIGGSDANTNINGQDFVMYAFAEINGFSKINSYTGNGSSDGPFVYTGFRPRFIMTKCCNGYASYWTMFDTARSPTNTGSSAAVWANSTDAEGVYNFDILSNGFKVRVTTPTLNQSGATYIYIAFAENPFKYANAR